MRPQSFYTSFLKTLDEAYRSDGLLAYFPWVFFLTTLGPTMAVWAIRGLDRNLSEAAFLAIAAAIMTVCGILAAVSISAMVQIQQIASTYPFSSYLEEEGLFDSFIFLPQFTFFVQISSAAAAVISIFIYAFSPDLNFELTISISGLFIYAAMKTFGLIDLIRIITWHHAKYMALLEEARTSQISDSQSG